MGDIPKQSPSGDDKSSSIPKRRGTLKTIDSFYKALQGTEDIAYLMDDLRRFAKFDKSSEEINENKTMAVFTWRNGGEDVYLLTNEDGEQRKVPMRRNGKSFMAIQYIQKEVIDYTFLVDGVEMCSPDMPTRFTSDGKRVNVMDCCNTVPIESIFALDSQDYSTGTYGYQMPDSHYMAQDPLTVPNAMLYRQPDFNNGDRVGNDIHVMANHIYDDTQSTQILGTGYNSYITIYRWEASAADISLARK
ncbi:5 -AMP-activated kinase subunit beta-1 family protein, putative [Babesia ovis]|uniref:5 -AMP-activated kinase subunit beta-1 family protein, putative n=1 Tax=Babesia ovis TaxID=5869 RepID=A0A9W5T9N7_BABOV|nr:5 -AMP-activated kinase subunit beta-1 family protein, putative [Babesia ovis]